VIIKFLYIYSCLPITFDNINSELFYFDSFCDSVMVYVGNFKRAINSTIGPVRTRRNCIGIQMRAVCVC